MKKILALALTLVMIFALAVPAASAANDGSVYWLNFKPELDETAQVPGLRGIRLLCEGGWAPGASPRKCLGAWRGPAQTARGVGSPRVCCSAAWCVCVSVCVCVCVYTCRS